MKNQGTLIFGLMLLLLGAALLASNLLKINLWAVAWPSLLIIFGVWLLARPWLPGAAGNFVPLGDVHRGGVWQAADDEFVIGIGDIKLDLTQASIPDGETTFKAFGFIGDVTAIIPEGVGAAISSAAFVSDAKLFGRKQESFLIPVQMQSDDYDAASRRIRLEVGFFISEVKVKRP